MDKNKKNSRNNELITVKIDDLAVGGNGVGRIDGKVVFVQKGVPGQVVKAFPFKTKKDYIEARSVEVVSGSEIEEKPFCDWFNICGGCSLQNIKYEEQLKFKKKWIDETFRRIGGLENINIKNTVPSPDTKFYRNKMEYSFSSKAWNRESKSIDKNVVGLGLHLPGRYDTVINNTECYLQSEAGMQILNKVREYTEQSGLPAYDIQKNRGFWRYLIIRDSKITNQILVNIVTNTSGKDEEKVLDKLAETLKELVPDMSVFVHSIHSGKSQAANWQSFRVVLGEGFIEDSIGEFNFKIDAGVFFQTNTKQVKNLYDIAIEAGEFKKDDVVYDLYSGIGTIPIYISKLVSKVVGMEIVEESIEAARSNAEHNSISNCKFLAGKIRVLIKFPDNLYKYHGKPDVVVIDPPRSGMDPKSLDRVIKMEAPRIVYISCNPSTLARDLKVFSEKYNIEYAVPVDMFPHTGHVETVVKMSKK